MQENELDRNELIIFIHNSLEVTEGQKIRITEPLSKSTSVRCNYKTFKAIQAEFKGIKNVPAYLKPVYPTTLQRLYFEIKGRFEIEKSMKGKKASELTKREKAVKCLSLLGMYKISGRQKGYVKEMAQLGREDKVSVELLDDILRSVLLRKG